jgi:hypothetical protein
MGYVLSVTGFCLEIPLLKSRFTTAPTGLGNHFGIPTLLRLHDCL